MATGAGGGYLILSYKGGKHDDASLLRHEISVWHHYL